MANEYDVVIVGSGFTGLVLAHLLENTSLKILMVERNSLKKMFDASCDNRGIALSQANCTLLQQLNLTSQWYERNSCIKQVKVSVKGKFGCVNLQDSHELGCVVDSAQLGQGLIKDFTNVVIKDNSHLENLNYCLEKNMWEFTLANMPYYAKLLVGADGINSIVRTKLGIANEQLFTEHSAMVCNITVSHVHQGIAYQRFIDNKVLALLPFGEKRFKCIITFPNYLQTSLDLPDVEYCNMVQDFIGSRIKILHASKRLHYPAPQITAHRITADNAVLIGNAANALSPIAAQGLNLGLRDVATLAYLLRTHGVGDVSNLLARYASARIDDHQRTSNFTKSIHKYMVDQRISWLTSAILLACELQPWLKDKIILQGKMGGYLA